MNSSTPSIRTFFLTGPAGRLEAVLNEGAPGALRAALVCHPHPVFGGTLHNKVVFHAMKAMNALGLPVLRFNFRGAGLSEGRHDQGRGEVDDVRAAMDWLHHEFQLPLIFAGFSFGAAVGLQAACPDPRVKACIGLGLPVGAVEGREYDLSPLRECHKPKLFISGDHDQYGPRPALEKVFHSLPEPKEIVFVKGADHFFAGHLHLMRNAVETWVQNLPE